MLVPLESLTLDPNNARKHSKRNIAAIAGSLEKFGQRKPIVVHGSKVIAGNGTVEAARSLGWVEIDVARVPDDWSEDEAKAYALADNRSAELAEWDEPVLAAQLVELDASGWDLSALGFDVPNAKDEPDLTDDEIPEEPQEPITKTGDLWVLGNHRVLCGDSFDETDRNKLIANNVIDLVATDPPYAIYGSSTGFAGNDIADDKMVRPFFESLARIVAGVIKPFGHSYMFTDWRTWAALQEGAKRAGITPKNMLVWDKGGGMGNMYAVCYELIAFHTKTPKGTKMTDGVPTGQRTVLRPNIMRYNRVVGAEREHNAAKPVELMEELIANSSDEGDIVLDLFGGSGSTLIAAENLGRRAFVMEMEPKYVDVIVKRWERKTGLTAELLSESHE